MIHIGVSRNAERIVVTCNNVDIISETYEDIASGKLQIRRFHLPRHSGLTTINLRNAFEYLEIVYIPRN